MAFKKIDFKTKGFLKKTMEDYNTQAMNAHAQGIPVAWVTAVFPVELLYAMDIFPYYPENFGAASGTHRRTEELSLIAERRGYSNQYCSYAKAGLGLMYGNAEQAGKEDFGGEMPQPDLLLPSNIQCTPLGKWFEITAKYYNKPLFLMDSPQIEASSWESQKAYFLQQIHELVAFLETSTGRKLDLDRLCEVLNLSTQACDLWNQVLLFAKNKPARITYWDACILMGPIVCWRGRPEAVHYYTELVKELEERAASDLVAVEGEKIRLYWDHIPIWPKMRYFAEFFGNRQTSIVCSLYTHSWAYKFDAAHPLETLAESYMREFVNYRFDQRVEKKIKLMREYEVDGFIFNLNDSCKPNSLALIEKKNVISERLGIPGMLLEADMCDPRFFAEGPIQNRMESFLEMIGSKK
ncbi:MAG: 2-hydroxyacyl-CoA dehydratase family protein [Peptococcaceae bacterium]|jgi:benzoyl-CoA reductase/2-hydroxyglutaryl-CoA dehydratase subunit BcrC/BadD/HgdB|nr:2-hydroxyacyl-CoA dehydratase family protein [Peptococcaceae bacterium]